MYLKHLAYLIIVFSTFTLLSSCETEADIKLPQETSKLVVISYISPQDTIIRVRVTLSLPIFGKKDISQGDHDAAKPFKDASVSISDGSSSVPLTFNQKEGQYTTESKFIKIEAGKTYFLNVSTPDGLKASAYCTVPVQNNTITIEGVDSSFYADGKIYTVTLRWEDNPSEINYYRIGGKAQHFHSTYVSQLEFGENDEFMTDTEAVSGILIREGKCTVYSGGKDYIKKIYGYIVCTDMHYYKYHKTLISARDESLFTEPTLIYSNIDGGFGIFCSYNKSINIIQDL